MGRSYVKKNQFVGPFSIIDLGLLHGIASVDQVDKVHAFDDAAVFHVQARNDAFSKHVFYSLVVTPRNSSAASRAGNCSGDVSVKSSHV